MCITSCAIDADDGVVVAAATNVSVGWQSADILLYGGAHLSEHLDHKIWIPIGKQTIKWPS